jgi:hypothetical protein
VESALAPPGGLPGAATAGGTSGREHSPGAGATPAGTRLGFEKALMVETPLPESPVSADPSSLRPAGTGPRAATRNLTRKKLFHAGASAGRGKKGFTSSPARAISPTLSTYSGLPPANFNQDSTCRTAPSPGATTSCSAPYSARRSLLLFPCHVRTPPGIPGTARKARAVLPPRGGPSASASIFSAIIFSEIVFSEIVFSEMSRQAVMERISVTDLETPLMVSETKKRATHDAWVPGNSRRIR